MDIDEISKNVPCIVERDLSCYISLHPHSLCSIPVQRNREAFFFGVYLDGIEVAYYILYVKQEVK